NLAINVNLIYTLPFIRPKTNFDVDKDKTRTGTATSFSFAEPPSPSINSTYNMPHLQDFQQKLSILEENLSEFLEAVQIEFNNFNKEFLKIHENFEKIRFEMADRMSELENQINMDENKILSIENTLTQQQELLNMVETYFGDLERKWGSPLLRSLIPSLLLILVVFRAIWNRIGHRYFLFELSRVLVSILQYANSLLSSFPIAVITKKRQMKI
ncbi:hypothetical protein HZS_1364, partial [Henneguya salminicola]